MQALKSLLASYTQREKQSRELAMKLMAERVDMSEIAHLIAQHVNQLSTSAAVQQQALLQSLTLALDAALQGPEQNLRPAIVRAHKHLTLAQGLMQS